MKKMKNMECKLLIISTIIIIIIIKLYTLL